MTFSTFTNKVIILLRIKLLYYKMSVNISLLMAYIMKSAYKTNLISIT